jgi:DNA-binding HxlR family transcriptional regulator
MEALAILRSTGRVLKEVVAAMMHWGEAQAEASSTAEVAV